MDRSQSDRPKSTATPAQSTSAVVDQDLQDLHGNSFLKDELAAEGPAAAYGQATQGSGSELPFQQEMEAAFGLDLGGVSVHTGQGASLGAMDARAATTGDSIAFADGAPDKETVAHEVAHVAQHAQGGSLGGVAAKDAVSSPAESAEQEADRAASDVMAGRPAQVRESAPDGIARVGEPGGAAALWKRSKDLHDKTNRIKSMAGELKGAAGSLEEAADGFFSDDQQLLSASRSLMAASKQIASAGDEFSEVTGKLKDLPFSDASRAFGRAERVLKAGELLVRLADDTTTQTFIDDPTPENAHAWATHTTGSFSAMADLIPDAIPGLPAFIPAMLKGYLNAPAVYVAAFESILYDYTHKIDSMSGISGKSSSVVDGDTLMWEGDLSGVYFHAPPDLRGFMGENRDEEGIDLYEVGKDIGIAHLLYLIDGYGPGGDREDVWLLYLKNRQKTA